MLPLFDLLRRLSSVHLSNMPPVGHIKIVNVPLFIVLAKALYVNAIGITVSVQ